MPKIYYRLIKEGKKTIEDVPEKDRSAVQALLDADVQFNSKNFLLKKEVKNMDVIYTTLIINGIKTFSQVPRNIKEKVRIVLVNLGFEELATE